MTLLEISWLHLRCFSALNEFLNLLFLTGEIYEPINFVTFSCFCLMQCIIRGMAGLQGPFYGGANAFHGRNTIYDLYSRRFKLDKRSFSYPNA